MVNCGYTVPMVISMLNNLAKIEQYRFYKGDFVASDMLIDLKIIMSSCKLTAKQKIVIEKHLIEGYTQEEVASMLGVTQQMIEKQCRAIKKKIGKVLIAWRVNDNEE